MTLVHRAKRPQRCRDPQHTIRCSTVRRAGPWRPPASVQHAPGTSLESLTAQPGFPSCDLALKGQPGVLDCYSEQAQGKRWSDGTRPTAPREAAIVVYPPHPLARLDAGGPRPPLAAGQRGDALSRSFPAAPPPPEPGGCFGRTGHSERPAPQWYRGTRRRWPSFIEEEQVAGEQSGIAWEAANLIRRTGAAPPFGMHRGIDRKRRVRDGGPVPAREFSTGDRPGRSSARPPPEELLRAGKLFGRNPIPDRTAHCRMAETFHRKTTVGGAENRILFDSRKRFKIRPRTAPGMNLLEWAVRSGADGSRSPSGKFLTAVRVVHGHHPSGTGGRRPSAPRSS